jgi:hypothetical protein
MHGTEDPNPFTILFYTILFFTSLFFLQPRSCWCLTFVLCTGRTLQSYWWATQPSTLRTTYVRIINNINSSLFQNSLLWQGIKYTNSPSDTKWQVIHPSTWWNTYENQSISSRVRSLKSARSRDMQTTPRSSSGSRKEIDLAIVAVGGVRWN